METETESVSALAYEKVLRESIRLREALEKYGDHEPCCMKGDACNCGFEQALKGDSEKVS